MVPGVSALYFAVAFMIAFTLWFGAWGAIAAYIGCFIGAGLGYVPLDVNLYWSLANFKREKVQEFCTSHPYFPFVETIFLTNVKTSFIASLGSELISLSTTIFFSPIVKMRWECFYLLPRVMWCIVMAIDFPINVSSFPVIGIFAR